MKKTLLYTLLAVALVVATVESAVITGTGGGVAGWPSSSLTKIIAWANSFANALRISDEDELDGWAFYVDPILGPVWNCFINNVENDCDYLRKLAAGKTWAIVDSGGTNIVQVVESVGASAISVLTGNSLTLSNLGAYFTASDTNPACAAGNYRIYADLSETKLKKCMNGSATDLDTTGGGETFVRKTANETVNNSNTRQADDALVFAVDANSYYTFSMVVLYSGATAADFQFSFTVPASATGAWHLHEYLQSTAASCLTPLNPGTSRATITDVLNSIGSPGVGTVCTLVIDGYVATAGTSGTVSLVWAQSTADATNTVVHADSHLLYRKQA